MNKNPNKRTKIFISYSHEDSKWLKKLQIHLKPLARDYEIEIWDDTRIKPGSDWRKEINDAVESARIAILLVSANFLASDFIATDELPPLLKAANEEGAIIIPVIISPCMYAYTKGISSFQAINDPGKPITKISSGNRDRIFTKIAETIYHDSIEKKQDFSEKIKNIRILHEDFLDPDSWNRLVKIGDWIFDQNKKRIIGAGKFSYLLSRKEYGDSEFSINVKLVFSNFKPQSEETPTFVNSGIILGWNANGPNPKYYNILITGSRLLLERIGFKGGDAYRDYEHLNDGIEFLLQENIPYYFTISYINNHIKLYINNEKTLSFSIADDVIGRVGIRPWRSQIECSHFEVKRLA